MTTTSGATAGACGGGIGDDFCEKALSACCTVSLRCFIPIVEAGGGGDCGGGTCDAFREKALDVVDEVCFCFLLL